jgi:hypothetical protein
MQFSYASGYVWHYSATKKNPVEVRTTRIHANELSSGRCAHAPCHSLVN